MKHILIVILISTISLIYAQNTKALTTTNTLNVLPSPVGDYLVDNAGRTLYMFASDVKGNTTCYDTCAVVWPAYNTTATSFTAGNGVNNALISTVTRKDGTKMIAFNGWPLYYYHGESLPGEIKCQAISESGGYWYVVSPTGEPIKTSIKTGTLQVIKSPHYGEYIVNSLGLPLYMFDQDTAKVSKCYDTCAVVWPPLFINSVTPANGGNNVKSDLIGTTERTDKTSMITYNNMPLYYYKGETTPGDTKCQGIKESGGFWWLVSSSGQVIKTAPLPISSSSWINVSYFLLLAVLSLLI